MNKEVKASLATAALLLVPALAIAHPGHGAEGLAHGEAGFIDGLVHPFTGLDHLAAMLAVGVWSALAVRPVWLAPAAFVALLVAGAAAGFLGVVVPAVEPMIAASLLVLGLLVAWQHAMAGPGRHGRRHGHAACSRHRPRPPGHGAPPLAVAGGRRLHRAAGCHPARAHGLTATTERPWR